VPWERSTTPLSWGRRGGLAFTSTPSPANQSSNPVGKSPFDLHGVPLSTRIRCGSPRRAKQRRSVVWVSPAGTVFQNPRGENRSLQDRSGALVDDAEPTGLAISQLHLVGGVDLPGLVRPLGPAVGSATTSADGRGVEPGLGEGPLDGPPGREGPAGMLLGEDHADDRGPPTRVLTPHRHCGRDQVGISPPRLVGATPGVIGCDPGGSGLAEPGDQPPDRVGLEPQIVGDGVGLMAEASPLEDHLPLGYGNGSSHPGPPQLMIKRMNRSHILSDHGTLSGKTRCPDFLGTT
jgi:hypothetical protein